MTTLGRRDFVTVAGGALVMSVLRTKPGRRAIRAAAFDGFALFDATAVLSTAEALSPGRGQELISAWRSRHFQYQWLRTMGGQYVDFQRTAEDALAFTCKATGIALSVADRRRLVEAQALLRPWPDALAAVKELASAGIRLAMLSNMTEAMLADGLARAGMREAFDFVLSTDRVRAAKPAPAAYALAPTAFGLSREEIAFVAFASWDAAGASWYGYPTAWLNKANAPAEELGAAEPRVTAVSLAAVSRWIIDSR